MWVYQVSILLFCGISMLFHISSANYLAYLAANTQGNNNVIVTVCVRYDDIDSPKMSSSKQAAPVLKLVDLSNSTGCTVNDIQSEKRHYNGTAVAVSRGNCTYGDKAKFIEAMNGSSVLVVDYQHSADFGVPLTKNSSIITSLIAWDDFHRIVSLPAPVQVRIFQSHLSGFDINMVVIVIASTLLILIGSMWATVEAQKQMERKHLSPSSESGPQGGKKVFNDLKDSSLKMFTPIIVIVWVCLLCAMIVLLYFFFDEMVYLFIATFVLFGANAMVMCLHPIWNRIFTCRRSTCTDKKAKCNIKFTTMVLIALCYGVAIFWAIERHASYAWIIQDIMGACFCVAFMSILRMPNLKILTILLCLLFCYDIFFVFITPLFTKDGESIMVKVATGNGSSREMIPLVFLIPYLSGGASVVCRERNFSLLGYGDVLLPGLLVAFNGIARLHTKTYAYHMCSLLAYGVGMSCCLVALVFMEKGQPALLYLVPCTLLTTYAVALKRGEVKMLWKGDFSKPVAVLPTTDTTDTDPQPSGSNDLDEDECLGQEDEEQRSLIQ